MHGFRGPFIAHTFGRHALPIVWDFAEVNPFSGSSGDWDGAIEWIVRVLTKEARAKSRAGWRLKPQLRTSRSGRLSAMVCTDPRTTSGALQRPVGFLLCVAPAFLVGCSSRSALSTATPTGRRNSLNLASLSGVPTTQTVLRVKNGSGVSRGSACPVRRWNRGSCFRSPGRPLLGRHSSKHL